MKNYLTLVLALSFAAAPALASRARLEALGEGQGGSYYIDDSRNIFLNPAEIVHYKKKLLLELGDNNNAAPEVSAAGALTSQVEGGFTNTFGDYTYGLYLNNNSQRAQTITGGVNSALAALGSTERFLGPDSTLEFFFAGEGATNWGVSLFYAGNNARVASGIQETEYLMGLRAGVDMNNWAVFTTIGLAESSKNKNATNDEIKGKPSFDLAATYKSDAMTYFVKGSSYGADITLGGAAATQDRNTALGLGFGHKHDFSKTVTMFTRLEASYLKSTNEGGAAPQAAFMMWNVPVVFGAEAQALSWLAIRGSIAQSLLGQTMNGAIQNSLANTTTIGAGVGLTFGDIQIDGLVASGIANNVETASAIGPTPGFGTAPQAKNNFGFGDNMLTRIAMTYNF